MSYQSIENFLNETTEQDINYRYSKPELYINYLKYCYDNNILSPMRKKAFNKFIESKFGVAFKSTYYWYYRGLKSKEPPKIIN
jgi:hypothetical protein